MKAALVLCLLAAPVLAAEPALAPAAAPLAGDSLDMGGQLVKLLLGLLLVIGLIFGLGFALRRMQQLGPRRGQIIRLVAVQHLGPRDRLALVEVGGEQVLLGLSGGRITPLHVLKDPVPMPEAEAAAPEFAQRLMELLGKDHKGGQS